MVACTAKPICIGLQPSGKSWRRQRPRSPVNRPRKRSDGRLYVRRLPERSRWSADPAHSHARCLFSGDQHVERLPRLGHVSDARRQFADAVARMSRSKDHRNTRPTGSSPRAPDQCRCDLGAGPHRMSCPAGKQVLGPSVSPAFSTIIPSHVGGGHIPDTAYTACGADVRILQ
jgi:hypothetical protein